MDKSLLLSQKTAEHEVEIDELGTVKVRALTRAEVLQLQDMARKPNADAGQVERFALSRALVDPAMSEDEVRQWQEIAPSGQLDKVSEYVMELSGLAVDAAKKSVHSTQA